MILLTGLFFYDIFWVFYTPVMVSVATNFDAPIKLLWPRNIIDYLLSQGSTGFTMLGLGDIVIPGIFVALCLRYDRHMSWKRNPVGQFRSLDFAKPYFTSAMISYFIGLATTMVVMHFFKAAQPALLYLSPACILSALITAAVRGEIKELFEFTTEEEKEEDEKKKKNKSKRLSKPVEEIILDEEDKENQAPLEEIELEEIELEEEPTKKSSVKKRKGKK